MSELLLISSRQIPRSGIKKSKSINTFKIPDALCQFAFQKNCIVYVFATVYGSWTPYFKRSTNGASQSFF